MLRFDRLRPRESFIPDPNAAFEAALSQLFTDCAALHPAPTTGHFTLTVVPTPALPRVQVTPPTSALAACLKDRGPRYLGRDALRADVTIPFDDPVDQQLSVVSFVILGSHRSAEAAQAQLLRARSRRRGRRGLRRCGAR